MQSHPLGVISSSAFRWCEYSNDESAAIPSLLTNCIVNSSLVSQPSDWPVKSTRAFTVSRQPRQVSSACGEWQLFKVSPWTGNSQLRSDEFRFQLEANVDVPIWERVGRLANNNCWRSDNRMRWLNPVTSQTIVKAWGRAFVGRIYKDGALGIRKQENAQQSPIVLLLSHDRRTSAAQIVC